MNKLLIASAAVGLTLAISGPAFAKKGFGTEATATQGSSGKTANTKNSTSSQGDLTTTTTSGPGNSTKMP